MSHELKNTADFDKGSGGFSDGDGETPPAELYQEFMQDISAEIDREGKIIDDLLTLVKWINSSPDLNIAQTSINGLLEQILKRLTPIVKRRNIEITYAEQAGSIGGCGMR